MNRLDRYFWVMLAFLVIWGGAVIVMPAAAEARGLVVDAGRLCAAAVATFFVAGAFGATRGRAQVLTSWVLCGAGVGAWLVADAMAAYYRVVFGTAAPYPSYHSLVMATAYGLITAGAAVEVFRRVPRASGQALVGALAVAALALILTVNFLVVPSLRNPATTAVEKAADVFFGFADYALAASALVLIARHGPSGFARPWVYVALGLIFYCTGDIIQWHLAAAGAGGEAGNVVSALFGAGGYLLIGLGAYYRRLISLGVVPPPRSRYVAPEVDDGQDK